MDIRERVAIEETERKAEAKAHDKRIEKLEGLAQSWNTLIRTLIIKTVGWLITVAVTGIVFGWNLPENLRKAIAEWIAK